MPSISSIGQSAGPSQLRYSYAKHQANNQQQVQPVARVKSSTDTDRTSLKLRVQTAEGDTVDLSIDASALSQIVKGPSGQQNTQASSVNAKISVKGDLSDQEVSDITSLIQSLVSGQQPDSQLSSLTAYKGSFSQTTGHQNSTVSLYA